MTQQNDLMISEFATKLIPNCFKSFLIKVFQTLNPSQKFEDNWHLDLMIEYLKSVENSETKRLIINVPPRSLKSTLISVAWPAWLLGNDPSKKIIVASYSQNLSLKHSVDCRSIINSEWYKTLFPKMHLMKGANVKHKFLTHQHGFRFATSILGTLTGEGADIIIVDDPHTPMQAASNTERKRAIDWYDHTLCTRLNNKKKGAIVLVMQRLHQDDLTGHLLDKKIWTHLKIPSQANNDITYQINDKKVFFKKGSFLHPLRENTREIENAKLELGSFAFNAQYMQDPIADDSALVKASWVKRYNKLPTEYDSCIQSWDCAVKIKAANDFSVCTTWYKFNNQYYLVDVFREKLKFLNLKSSVMRLAELHLVDTILIEDKSSGQSLIQELETNTSLPIIPISPHKDKETRFISILSIFESGKIILPKNAPWLADFEAELFAFPNSKHDDQIDSMTQFLKWSKEGIKNIAKVRFV
jgi:predicted phage terminase large subunit-like protein